MVYSVENILAYYPRRVKIKVATYFFKKHVTIPTLVELHGEILSKPTVVHLKEAIRLYEK